MWPHCVHTVRPNIQPTRSHGHHINPLTQRPTTTLLGCSTSVSPNQKSLSMRRAPRTRRPSMCRTGSTSMARTTPRHGSRSESRPRLPRPHRPRPHHPHRHPILLSLVVGRLWPYVSCVGVVCPHTSPAHNAQPTPHNTHVQWWADAYTRPTDCFHPVVVHSPLVSTTERVLWGGAAWGGGQSQSPQPHTLRCATTPKAVQAERETHKAVR